MPINNRRHPFLYALLQIRFLPPTLLLHLVAACYGSIYQPAIGEQSLRGAAAARALAIAVALPVGIVLFSWAAIMFGVSFLRDSKSTLHWALLMSALTVCCCLDS